MERDKEQSVKCSEIQKNPWASMHGVRKREKLLENTIIKRIPKKKNTMFSPILFSLGSPDPVSQAEYILPRTLRRTVRSEKNQSALGGAKI